MSESRAFWVETPNARLVYMQIDPKPDLTSALANAVNSLSELERVVLEESRYQWANPDIFLYFFCQPTEDDFPKTPLWIAREVVGPPNEDVLERFSLHDLQAGRAFQLEIGKEIFELEALKQLKEFYDAAHRQMKAQHTGSVASTWRLKLQNDGKSSRAQIQLFPE